MKRKTIPVAMRKAVIIRDQFMCQYCGKVADVSFRNKNGIYQVGERIKEYIEWGGIWHLCLDEYIAFEIDHLIPDSKGGPTHPINLVLTCRRCNRSKGDK